MDDRTDDCAVGADDVVPRRVFRKLRFQMIADIRRYGATDGCQNPLRFFVAPVMRICIRKYALHTGRPVSKKLPPCNFKRSEATAEALFDYFRQVE